MAASQIAAAALSGTKGARRDSANLLGLGFVSGVFYRAAGGLDILAGAFNGVATGQNRQHGDCEQCRNNSNDFRRRILIKRVDR